MGPDDEMVPVPHLKALSVRTEATELVHPDTGAVTPAALVSIATMEGLFEWGIDEHQAWHICAGLIERFGFQPIERSEEA